MIPRKTLRSVIFVTNVAWLCGAVPYRFIKKNNRYAGGGEGPWLVPSFTKWRTAFIRTSFALNCFYISFIAFRVFQKVAKGEELSLSFLVQMGYLFLSYTMTVVLQINTLLFWEEIPNFITRYLAFFGYIKDTFLLPGKSGPKCIKFFGTILVIGILVNLQNSIIIMKKPSRPHFLTSIFQDPLKTPFVVRLPFLLMHGWVWTSTWAQIWTFIFHLYTYISCMVWTIRELDLQIKTPKTNRSLRETKVFTRTIRSMHVLHRLWQHSHQTWFCPSHKAAAIGVGTLSSYGVLKLSGPRSIIMGCIAMLCLMYLWTLFRKFGQLHELSGKVRDNWIHSTTTTKWMKKYLQSVPIFRIDVGSFYYVQKTTVIAVMWTVLNNTVTLLFL